MTQPDLPPTAVRPAALRAAAAVGDLRRRVAERHAAGGDALETCRFATDLFDELIRDLWAAILDELGEEQCRAARGITLVAHG